MWFVSERKTTSNVTDDQQTRARPSHSYCERGAPTITRRDRLTMQDLACVLGVIHKCSTGLEICGLHTCRSLTLSCFIQSTMTELCCAFEIIVLTVSKFQPSRC